MANLNAWQKLDRVLPGKPFGNGSDGAYSSATIPTLTKDSCSGTATSTTLTTSGSTFANGDILLIHQTRGTGAGQWEINKVASGGGSTSLTLSVALNYTYTDSGASQAQAIKIPQYTDVTVQSGTWTVPGWDGNVGGIFPIACRGTMTVTGTITDNSNGFLQPNGTDTGSPGICGEGTGGASARQKTANGSGGGGGGTDDDTQGGAGGGGNATTGTSGSGGAGGTSSGAADATTITLGGAGGNGQGTNSAQGSYPGRGGNGAALIFIFAKAITSVNSIILIGATGADGYQGGSGYHEGGGGGGAGGSCVIVCQTAAVGSAVIVATGGTGGTGINSGNGGAGSTGRIAVHHSGTVTGTTNPTFTDVTDTSLVEVSSGSGMMAFFM